MTYKAYFLTFTAPLHLGDYKPDSYESSESFLRSDTLYAAIIATWAKLGKEEYIGDGNLPFVLSSAYPYYGEIGKEVKFFPRPKLSFNMPDRDPSISKKIKKITWLDQYYFEKVIKNENLPSDITNFIYKDFLSETKLEKEFMTKQVSERVAIPRDRTEKDSEPFYMERIYFNDGGLYFLATGDHFDWLEEALNLLKEEGIGTDRNIGNGFFEWHTKEITLNLPSDSEYSMNMGLFCPTSQSQVKAMVDDNGSYDLVKRGGWITTHGMQGLEKNSIYMFSEGSIIKTKNGVEGNGNINLRPEILKDHHPIYRSGKTIFIPVKI